MPKSVVDLLAEREGTRLEFKRNLSSMSRVLETVCSFLNTAGGTLVVGVQDDRAIAGLPDVERDEETLANAVSAAIEPQPTVQLEIVTHQDKDLLLLRASYAAGPFYVKRKGREKGTYIRIGSNSLPASPEKIAELERARQSAAWDQEPAPGLTRGALDRAAIDRWAASVGEDWNDAKLRSLGVLTQHAGKLVPTRAGIILFGKERELHFPDAHIRRARFRGTDKRHPVAGGVETERTVLDGIETTLAFLERNTEPIPLITSRTQRRDIEPYPSLAVREILNNAVAHTDYAVEGASIFVALYADRLEISSPGTWPPGYSREDFESGVSLRRNKAISRVLMRLRVMEGYGSGYDRITAACRDGGYPGPEWIENGPQIKVVLRPHPSSAASAQRDRDSAAADRARAKVRRAPQERRDAILAALDELERPNTRDLAQRTGISERSLDRDLRALREDGLVEFVGSRQTGYYRRKPIGRAT